MIRSYKDLEVYETFECQYISREITDSLCKQIEEIGKMLTSLNQNWKSHGK
ncbi:four helix bundle protein [Marinoscillum sp. MHG1-6]|uniref:four helix bundle protein n=1 Tax=Marinoscillum sp. MHG1-6 TaxID=2959627 RepID=UPI0021585026|nr:four helix bundle protein [Marinoscillum sp. MHG1-6]